jgi:transposase
MSMHPQEISPVPEETARVARAANPKWNTYMRMRDELGSIYEDQMFTALFPRWGQLAEAPWRLALVTVMQYMEGLSDRQAAEAVRERIDWKYALSLELTDPGFDFSVLSEFRTRLLTGGAETHLLQALLELCKSRGWLKARGRQRIDSTHVLAAIRDLNRLECAGETLRHTLNVLAEVAPDWLLTQIDEGWFDRYSHRFDEYRFRHPHRLNASHSHRRLEPMVIGCSAQCTRRLLLSGWQTSRQWKPYAGCGCSSIS